MVIAIRDIAPRAPTHILLLPRRHIGSAADLVESDGPMLVVGLQQIDGRLIELPRRPDQRPDPDRLAARLERFRVAS